MQQRGRDPVTISPDPFPPKTRGYDMSARDRLVNLLLGNREQRTARADEILAEHAAELADRIRNSDELRDLTDDHMGDCNAAADFIDPTTSN